MSPSELLKLILGVSALVILVSAAGFVVLGKFLNKERKRAEIFRDIYRDESRGGS